MPIGELDPSLEQLAREVVDAAYEVHQVLGPGFVESVYERALVTELKLRKIPHERQVPVDVHYKGENVGCGVIDVLVDNRLVIELKATERIARIHVAQLISYLKASGHRLGFVITFDVSFFKDGVRRVVFDRLAMS